MSIYCYHKQKSVFLNSVPHFSFFSQFVMSKRVRPLIRSPPSPPARWSLNGCKVLEP